MKLQTQIPVTAYKAAGFFGRYQQLVRDEVISYQHSVSWDKSPDKE